MKSEAEPLGSINVWLNQGQTPCYWQPDRRRNSFSAKNVCFSEQERFVSAIVGIWSCFVCEWLAEEKHGPCWQEQLVSQSRQLVDFSFSWWALCNLYFCWKKRFQWKPEDTKNSCHCPVPTRRCLDSQHQQNKTAGKLKPSEFTQLSLQFLDGGLRIACVSLLSSQRGGCRHEACLSLCEELGCGIQLTDYSVII